MSAASSVPILNDKRGGIMAIKIYIDQGHNPENPNAGAEGNGLREQDLTYRRRTPHSTHWRAG